MMYRADVCAFPCAYLPAFPTCIGAIAVAKCSDYRAGKWSGELAAHLTERHFIVMSRAVTDQCFNFGQQGFEAFSVSFALFQTFTFAAHLAIKLSEQGLLLCAARLELFVFPRQARITLA